MALTYSLPPNNAPLVLGQAIPDFSLNGILGLKRFPKEQPQTKEGVISLTQLKQENARALLVIFMCNHCPYVIAVQNRINQLAKKYSREQLWVIGINSNDPSISPEDSFDAMKVRAEEENYLFDYLFDETQKVAKLFGAVCTPDPYLFENKGGQFILRYHGRIDNHWKNEKEVTEQDLDNAVMAILEGNQVNSAQKPAMGCSIKWK